MLAISRPSMRMLWLVLAGASSSACGGGGSEPDTEPGVSQANPLDAEESAMVDAINDLRAPQGAEPVRACTTLNISTSKHSDDMRDRDYIDQNGLDGSTPASRACDAGYQAGCDASSLLELVAFGHADATGTLGQWTEGHTAALTDPGLAAIGVGRSMDGDSAIWTVDLAAEYETSCD